MREKVWPETNFASGPRASQGSNVHKNFLEEIFYFGGTQRPPLVFDHPEPHEKSGIGCFIVFVINMHEPYGKIENSRII